MAMFNANDFNFGGTATNNYLQQFNAQGQMGQGFNGGLSPSQPGGEFNLGGLGFNMDTAKLGLSGIQTLGNLWNAFQAQQLARDQFNFTKGITEKNLANQIKSYNTTLEDRIRARGFTEGQSQSQIDEYTSRNRVA